MLPFALPLTLAHLRDLGCGTAVRTVDGERFVTDNGNVIVDCAVDPIADPPAFERRLRTVPGVVDTGLFLGTADLVMVGEREGTRVLVPEARYMSRPATSASLTRSSCAVAIERRSSASASRQTPDGDAVSPSPNSTTTERADAR